MVKQKNNEWKEIPVPTEGMYIKTNRSTMRLERFVLSAREAKPSTFADCMVVCAAPKTIFRLNYENA